MRFSFSWVATLKVQSELLLAAPYSSILVGRRSGNRLADLFSHQMDVKLETPILRKRGRFHAA